MHRRFGDAIHVHQLRLLVAMPLEPRLETLHFQCFTAKDDVAQRQFHRLAKALLGLDQFNTVTRSRASSSRNTSGERLVRYGTTTSRPP